MCGGGWGGGGGGKVGRASPLIEVSQASVARPFDRNSNRMKMKVKIKTLKWWK
jgi:hypothetical protein